MDMTHWDKPQSEELKDIDSTEVRDLEIQVVH